MPRRAASGTKGLIKRHHCGHRSLDPTKCPCQWSGKYGQYEVVLGKWANCKVDPFTKKAAVKILNRFFAAIDAGTFDPAGERVLGGPETLASFITEWKTHYAEERGLVSTSLDPMLNVLAEGTLGRYSLREIGGASQDIERWLNAEGKARKWKAKTWNGYHELLNRVLKRATMWEINGKPRLVVNPMVKIERKVATKPHHFKARHLVEDVEDRLFAVVDQLNRPQHRPNRNKLTYEKAGAIRAALVAGQQGKAVAAMFGVSPAVVSAVKYGDIWNPDRVKPGNKGDEMRRRLIAAFDLGLRAGEMLRVQLQHVNWKPLTVSMPDGTRVEAYEIVLPPQITKGGKTTGETERVYATTARSRHVLESRRFALKNNKDSRTYIWGAEDGRQVTGFRRMWHELFTLAGLDWGRDNGLVWHTTRHEYISRVAETARDARLAQGLARHRNLETTEGYLHTRRDRLLMAAAGLERGK